MKQIKKKMPLNRKQLFDHRRYQHIGWYLCDDPEMEIDLETMDGVKRVLANCVLSPICKTDERKGAFLLAQFFDYTEDCQDLVVRTYNRYATGFAENEEFFYFTASPHILEEIDNAIDTEWRALLRRMEEQSFWNVE